MTTQTYSSTKFDSKLAETLYERSLDGAHDDECGSVSENGVWYGLFETSHGGYILWKDSLGFVGVVSFKSVRRLTQAWEECLFLANEYEDEAAIVRPSKAGQCR
jgi:hypothetical protein